MSVIVFVVCCIAGHDRDGQPVYLEDIWPSRDEILVNSVRVLLVYTANSLTTHSYGWNLQ